MIVSATAADHFAEVTAIGTNYPNVKVVFAVTGKGDPLAIPRPIGHGIGPITIGQSANVTAIMVHDVKIFMTVAPRAEYHLLTVRRKGWEAIVACLLSD